MAAQGEAYARGENGKWFWTTKPTPGIDNVISVAESQSIAAGNVLGVKVSANGYMEVALEKIGGLEIGSLVKIQGLDKYFQSAILEPKNLKPNNPKKPYVSQKKLIIKSKI